MRKRKMAYLMHVDVDWIKQRPHFIAEKLAGHFHIDLYHVRNMRSARVKNPKSRSDSVVAFKILKVPYSSRCRWLKRFEQIINCGTVSRLYKESYHLVWITSPIILDFVDVEWLGRQKIVYDCMDDVLAFSLPRSIVLQLEKHELWLAKHSALILASSEELRKRIKMRYGIEAKVVHNALEPGKFSFFGGSKTEGRFFSLGYFGTIADWFDFETIIAVLDRLPEVRLLLIGPAECMIPKHDRILHMPPVRHEALNDILHQIDALIMPFKVNELIRAVDPVKAYEYIATGLPSVLVKYDETEKFGNYSYLYENSEELIQIIEKLSSKKIGPKQKESTTRAFVRDNDWDNRVKLILSLLENVV